MESQTDYSQYYFYLKFWSCNSFRQILEFLQNHKNIPFIFTKDKFCIRKPNDKNTILFESIIEGNNLAEFYMNNEVLEQIRENFDTEDPDYDPDQEPEYFVHIPILPILTNLKRFNKKKKFCIYQLRNDEEFIHMRPEEEDQLILPIRIDPSKELPICLTGINIPKDPNLTFQLTSFNYPNSGPGRISDKISKLRAYLKGLDVYSPSIHGNSCIKRGNTNGEPICEIGVSGDTIKSISKLSSLSEEGIAKIYCTDNTHILIQIPISVIGISSIYFMSADFSV